MVALNFLLLYLLKNLNNKDRERAQIKDQKTLYSNATGTKSVGEKVKMYECVSPGNG